MNAYSLDALTGILNELYGGQPLFVTPYQYTVDIGAPGANVSVTKTLQITSNLDFLLTQILGDVADDTNVTAGSKLLIVENQSGDPFTYGPCPVNSLVRFYLNANPAPLMFPRLLQGRSSLSVQWVQADAAPGADITLIFDGLNVRGM